MQDNAQERVIPLLVVKHEAMEFQILTADSGIDIFVKLS